MRKVFVSAVFACTFFVLGSRAAQTEHSQVGTWKLDVSQSNFSSEHAPKAATLRVLKDTPTMLSWRVQIVDDKGTDRLFSWSGPKDGSMHPVMQNGKEVSKQSAKIEGDGSLHRHGEDPDGSSFDAYSKVSDNSTSITDEITTRTKGGKESKEKTVYRRASPCCFWHSAIPSMSQDAW
jgi:hypothetical protein